MGFNKKPEIDFSGGIENLFCKKTSWHYLLVDNSLDKSIKMQNLFTMHGTKFVFVFGHF